MRSWRALVEPVQAGALYLLLFLLPFSKAVVEVTFGILLATWLIQRLDPRTRSDTIWQDAAHRPLLLAAIAFLSACALSVAFSGHQDLSLRAWFSKWLEYVLFWIIVADVARRPHVVPRALAVIACSTLPVMLEGAWQEWTEYGLFRKNMRINIFQRMTGPYENPIDLATYFMMTIPPVTAYAMWLNGPAKRLVWVLVGGLVMCLAKTLAFGAIAGLCLGLVVMCLCDRSLRRIGIAAVAGVLMVAAVALFKAGYLYDTLSWSELSKLDRLAVWQAGWNMFMDRPLLGHGLNTFMANYLQYWVGGEQMPRYAHNCYLQMAAETGIIGVAAFVWLLGALLWHVTRRVLASNGEQRLILLGFLVSLVAFTAQAAIDTNFYALRQVALFWTYAGLATGYAVSRQRPRRG